MPPLTIPERYRLGLAANIVVPRDAVDGIASVLARAPEDLSSGELGALVASDVPNVSPDAATSVVSTLASLYLLRAGLELSVPEVVDEISDAMATSGYPELEVSDEELPEFKSKLVVLLGIDSLMRKWKSREAALPYILEDRRERGGQWYWALEHIMRGKGPRSDPAWTTRQVKSAWFEWGRARGYLTQ